jgi:predicted Zn finger-like uncharacterized protein
MIITCINCDKKFDVVTSLIPEKGRLLQCNSCNHKWFFKKENINEPIKPVKTNYYPDKIELFKKEIEAAEVKSPEPMELLDKSPENEKKKNDYKRNRKNSDIDTSKKINNSNILGLTIIFIISFIAIIIIMDTFQVPISKIVPDIEFILYNLYESINDLILFFSDLI